MDDTAFIGNVIQNAAASGLTVDLNLEGNPSDTRKISRNVVIQNNAISGIGLDYHQSVGIMATYTDSAVIEHNEVSNVSYSGISVGFGWADRDNAARNNIVRYNEVYNVLNVMADGGGIYTLSRQPGTLIAENYVHNIARGPWHGSYRHRRDLSRQWKQSDHRPRQCHPQRSGFEHLPEREWARATRCRTTMARLPLVIANAGIQASFRIRRLAGNQRRGYHQPHVRRASRSPGPRTKPRTRRSSTA